MSIWQSLTAEEKIAAVKKCLLEGLSTRAIARQTGAPAGSIPTMIHRHRLRDWLKREITRRAQATGPLWRDLDRDGRIAAIRVGIEDGMTSSAIARHHGTTRSAICGAANRAGIRFSPAPVISAISADVINLAERREGMGSPAAAPAAETGKGSKPPVGSDPPAVAGRTGPRPAPNSPAAPSPEAAGEPEPGAPAAFPENGVRPAPGPVMPQAAPREQRPAGGKRLMDLVFGDCRFPLWGAARPAFGEMRFCARPVVPGKAWCGEHHAVCVVGKAEVPKAVLDVARDAGRRAGR